MADIIGVADFFKIKGLISGNANDLGNGIFYYSQSLGVLSNSPGGNFGFIISISYSNFKMQIGSYGGPGNLLVRSWYSGSTGWTSWKDL